LERRVRRTGRVLTDQLMLDPCRTGASPSRTTTSEPLVMVVTR